MPSRRATPGRQAAPKNRRSFKRGSYVHNANRRGPSPVPGVGTGRAAKVDSLPAPGSPGRPQQDLPRPDARRLAGLVVVAEFERAIIRERVSAGLRAARARGVRLGRPAANGQHGVEVRRLRAAGKGVRAIARELGLPVASVHKLTREAEHAA